MSKLKYSLKFWDVKNQSFYYQNNMINYSVQGESFHQTKHKTNPWSSSISIEWHIIVSAILDFVEKTEKHQHNFTRRVIQGQYAYCKYLEIISGEVLEWEQKQVTSQMRKTELSSDDLIICKKSLHCEVTAICHLAKGYVVYSWWKTNESAPRLTQAPDQVRP